MAKGFADTDSLCRELLADIRKKIFRPVYLLMGEEPFYPDMVCDAIIRNALDESEIQDIYDSESKTFSVVTVENGKITLQLEQELTAAPAEDAPAAEAPVQE